jgi:hypothetical protein
MYRNEQGRERVSDRTIPVALCLFEVGTILGSLGFSWALTDIQAATEEK